MIHKNVGKYYLVCFLLITVYSCKRKSDSTYDYEILNEAGQIKGYAKLKVSYFKNFRSDTLIYFDTYKNRIFEDPNIFESTTYGLNIGGKGYLINSVADSCYYWGQNEVNLKICYQGERELHGSENSKQSVHVFVFEELMDDGVKYEEMYDKNLILLYRETKNSPVYVKIIRSDKNLSLN